MTCQTIQIPNIFDLNQAFFQSDFQTTIQTQDHLTTGHKTTIWIPDLSSIQMVTVQCYAAKEGVKLIEISMKSFKNSRSIPDKCLKFPTWLGFEAVIFCISEIE